MVMTISKNPSRLTDTAKRLVAKTLKEDRALHDETVIWDAVLAVFPDPSATDPLEVGSSTDPSAVALLPTLAIYLEIPGPDPERSMYISTILAPYQLDQARVDKAVNSALQSMRDSRQHLVDNSSEA